MNAGFSHDYAFLNGVTFGDVLASEIRGLYLFSVTRIGNNLSSNAISSFGDISSIENLPLYIVFSWHGVFDNREFQGFIGQ
jgi:hypothetical protein